MDSDTIYQLKYHIPKKEFQEGLFDLVFKEAKNKEEVENNKYIQIPNSVTSIGYWAFANCNSLISITIPEKFESQMNTIFKDVDLSKVKITYY